MPVEGGTGGAVVSPATSTLRDEMAVSGQRLLAASGQIPMAAHTRPTSGSAEATLSSGRFFPHGTLGGQVSPVFPQVHRPMATHPDTMKGGRVTANRS